MILDLYLKYYQENGGKYTINNRSETRFMFPLSIEERDELSFKYTQALQDFVVRGVKHGSSSDFEILFLRNFWKPENNKEVMKLLTQGLKMTPKLASRMFSVITWAEDTGFLSSCGSFLRLYNKGTEPYTDEAIEAFNNNETYIQGTTYFGMLLESIYNLRQKAKLVKEQRKEELDKLLSGGLDSNQTNENGLSSLILGF